MNRKPPEKVKKILRSEIGFGCPIPGCGNPYLEWHHFDPPWHIENHHKQKGMIALCREHHIQADNDAFTIDQLREYKEQGLKNWEKVKGEFNWLRNRILAVVGGNFYYETPVIFKFKGKPIIWFERNDQNYLLLNLHMLSISKEPRACIVNNQWFSSHGEVDIECPPSAKRLKIEYQNGDLVKIEYSELKSFEDAKKKFPDAWVESWPITLPITTVEVTLKVAGTKIDFSPRQTKIGGITMIGNFTANCGAGIAIG